MTYSGMAFVVKIKESNVYVLQCYYNLISVSKDTNFMAKTAVAAGKHKIHNKKT